MRTTRKSGGQPHFKNVVVRWTTRRSALITNPGDLSALQDWADRWGLCFNPSKCSVLRVSRPKSKNLEFEYTLKGETLANVSSTPYLGVCLSETLEWEAHINKITSKANSTLGFLQRNLKACPPKLRETAYFSLVR